MRALPTLSTGAGPAALGDSTGTLADESVIFAKQRAPLQFLCWNQLFRLGDEAEPTVGSLVLQSAVEQRLGKTSERRN